RRSPTATEARRRRAIATARATTRTRTSTRRRRRGTATESATGTGRARARAEALGRSPRDCYGSRPMAKEEKVELEGEVIEALPNAMFRVKLDNDHVVLGHVA